MKINDLLDMREVARLAGEGYLRERQHPLFPQLRILGYTEKSQWERVWTPETTACRGLIYDAATREVLARPWPKFFNHGEYAEAGKPELRLDQPVQVSDKMDGSLGILFLNPYTNGWEVATRGSFDSDQARLANAELLPALLDGWEPASGWTYLAEIIFRENRIVLDYGDRRELSLLGAVRIETGETEGPDFDGAWPGSRAEVFEAATLAEALAMEPRPNAEGLVVRYLHSGRMVKIKQEDYVRLHKIVTGLSDKAVWEHLSSASPWAPLGPMLESVPDEFHKWVQDTAREMVRQYAAIDDASERDLDRILTELGEGFGRREFAELAKKTDRPHLMFQKLDGRDHAPAIWKELRPVGVRYMSGAAAEEVA